VMRNRWELDTPHGPLVLGSRCLVMGVLNVTPDSFSDGGRYFETATATNRARELVAEGADVLDIGGESTRPGATPVGADEQMRRVLPVVQAVRDAAVGAAISVDTQSAIVAAAALDAGADIINDVSAARTDPEMPRLLADRRVPFVAMHMLGTPGTMQDDPRYGDVVAEVAAFFERRADVLARAGVDVRRMIVDPGIGFGKNLAHNLALLRSIGSFVERWPVLVGPSRKRFLGELLGERDPDRRIMGTAAVVAYCAMAGVHIVRVHDVRAMRQVLRVCSELKSRDSA